MSSDHRLLTESEAMPMSYDFLFATFEGGGNIAPALTLARRLRDRGHRVRLMSDACTRAEAEAAGIEFAPWRKAPSRVDHTPETDVLRDWEPKDPVEVIGRLVDRMMCGPAAAHAADVLDELRRRPADVVVSSELLLGPMIGAEAAGVPVVTLSCNVPLVPRAGVPPFGPGFAPARNEEERRMHAAAAEGFAALLRRGLPPVSAAREELGLEPVDSVHAQFARADRYMVAAAPAFDFPAESLPENMVYVGPLLDEPTWAAEWDDPWPGDERPLVAVAFSTTFQDQVQTLQRTADALAGLPVRAVLTTGPSIDPASLQAPPNVAVLATAPHDRLMRDAAVVITHCGHGTLMRALRAGAAVLCMPMGRDQNDNAVRVTERGAGLQLPPDAPAEEIRQAVTRLLEEPAFRRNARELGRAVAAAINPEAAADELEALAARAAGACAAAA
jgi:MGT family glycosyltransferase